MKKLNKPKTNDAFFEEQTLYGHDVHMPMVLSMGYVISKVATPRPWHEHDGIELQIVSRGGASYEFADGGKIELSSGMFLIAAPCQYHQAGNGAHAPSERYWILFSKALGEVDVRSCSKEFQQRFNELCAANFNTPFLCSKEVSRLLDRFQSAMRSRKDMETQGVFGELLYPLVHQIMVEIFLCLKEARPAKVYNWVPIAVEFLHQHYLEDISIDDIMRQFDLERSSIFFQFKESTGYTPHDYLQRLRIKHAEELLLNEKLSITSIAFASGFNSSDYFSVVFKRFTNQSPSEFRKSAMDKTIISQPDFG